MFREGRVVYCAEYDTTFKHWFLSILWARLNNPIGKTVSAMAMDPEFSVMDMSEALPQGSLWKAQPISVAGPGHATFGQRSFRGRPTEHGRAPPPR